MCWLVATVGTGGSHLLTCWGWGSEKSGHEATDVLRAFSFPCILVFMCWCAPTRALNTNCIWRPVAGPQTALWACRTVWAARRGLIGRWWSTLRLDLVRRWPGGTPCTGLATALSAAYSCQQGHGAIQCVQSRWHDLHNCYVPLCCLMYSLLRACPPCGLHQVRWQRTCRQLASPRCQQLVPRSSSRSPLSGPPSSPMQCWARAWAARHGQVQEPSVWRV